MNQSVISHWIKEMKIKVFIEVMIVCIGLTCFTSCFENNKTSVIQSKNVSWIEKYETELIENFVDEKTGDNIGIKNIEIDGSLIYITIDDTISRDEYLFMVRAWARKYSIEKQKHGGSNVTAYIKRNGKIIANINYSKSGGFKQ